MIKISFLSYRFSTLSLSCRPLMQVVCIDSTQIIGPITVANNMFIVRFMQVTGETEIIKCWSTHEVRL